MQLALIAVLLGTTAAATPLPSSLPPAARTAAQAVAVGTIAGTTRFLASDLLEGRAPSHRGALLARTYLATELEALGLAPGGPEGGWEQRFPIVGINTQVPETWRFDAGDRHVELTFWKDFIAASGVQVARASVSDAEVVFVGYGIQAPEYGWDDYKGADLRGKILLMLNNDPDWDPGLFAGTRRLHYGRWDYKYESAARQGAVGAIIVHTTPSAGYGWRVVQNSWTGEQFELPADDGPRLQVKAWTTEDATRKLLAAAGFDLDQLVAKAHERSFHPVPLGVHTSLALTNEMHRSEGANVLGLLTGSDPTLTKEVVVYVAHFDHLGVGTPDESGDRVYNGARDNASGCAQVLGIARAFTRLEERPRRSVLFIFVTGEESGLLGSGWYAEHPTFAPGRIAACINFDAGNIFGRSTDVSLIGDGKSSMDEVAKAAAALQGRTVTGETEPDKGSFYRSDQFSLAKIGVPALYFKAGQDYVGRPAGWGQEQSDRWLAEHYHRPSDEITADWDFSGLVEDAQLGFYAGLMVANADAMPVWNAGDEFEVVREKALAEVRAQAQSTARGPQ
jgi:Zn-dependent M28 family amino/carboxypeptidase